MAGGVPNGLVVVLPPLRRRWWRGAARPRAGPGQAPSVRRGWRGAASGRRRA